MLYYLIVRICFLNPCSRNNVDNAIDVLDQTTVAALKADKPDLEIKRYNSVEQIVADLTPREKGGMLALFAGADTDLPLDEAAFPGKVLIVAPSMGEVPRRKLSRLFGNEKARSDQHYDRYLAKELGCRPDTYFLTVDSSSDGMTKVGSDDGVKRKYKHADLSLTLHDLHLPPLKAKELKVVTLSPDVLLNEQLRKLPLEWFNRLIAAPAH